MINIGLEDCAASLYFPQFSDHLCLAHTIRCNHKLQHPGRPSLTGENITCKIANVYFNNHKTNHNRIHSIQGLCFSSPFLHQNRQPENIITLVLVFLLGLCAKSGIDY